MEPSPAVQRAAEAVAEAVARAGGSHGPRMHPFERMAARPCVVEAVEGSVEVEGNYLGTTIIDMGASQVLIGRRLAEHLGLHQEENVTPEGVRIPTAERGGRQMPAKDLAFAGGSVGSRERERSETQGALPHLGFR
ncbi:hypothetical protein CLOM_g4489 [Closterium sp. NIES-68]|nr:hypothetical protein CLOM_g4489 [Closterium sp. NIES-68]